MDPNVPSLEACRRLGEAGWPQEDSNYAWVATSGSQETGGWYVCQGASRHFSNKRMAVAAPTIGEMLAWVAKADSRLDAVSASLLRQMREKDGLPSDDCFYNFLAFLNADALANALAEAMEREASDASG